ncbi:DUF2924 domain-containing protein [Micromonospora sp. STR1s_5]|nr:DUF2924 domain-containing protein [Micromonospora sp. STR1s_5]
MADRLEADLARIGSMDLAGLRARWRKVFGRAAPEGLPRSLLQRVLAHRVQVDALGDLDRETVRALDRLARGEGDLPAPERPGTKPGTLLVREWEGNLHRVMVLEEGFAWNGQRFESLSKVARAITGTTWNGPRFFGLRQKGNVTGSGDRRSAG